MESLNFKEFYYAMLGTIVAITVGLVLLYHSISFSRKRKLINKIPGPKGLPLIGNVFDFIMDPVALFYKSRSTIAQFKRLYRVWIIQKPIINLYDPDDIEVLLSSSKYIAKSDYYQFLQPWLGDGLLLSKGSKWHSRRKILTPAFHFNILRQFCKIFEEQSLIAVNKLRNEINPDGINVIPFVTDYTLNAICETAMGTCLNNEDMVGLSTEKYKEAVHTLGDLLIYRLVRIWFHFTTIFNISPSGKKQTKVLKTLHTFSTDVIRQRRKNRSSNVKTSQGNTELDSVYTDDDRKASKKKRLAMLDLLLDAEESGNIDELGIREEVDTFMFEGYDTTSLAIIYTLMNLANNDDIQAKVYHEILAIFGDSDRQATMEDLQNMKYLECCLKEVLRLYPSVPFISRHLDEEMQLKNYLIPANTLCHVFIYDLHRNPDIYPIPDKFDPDRFLPENATGRHPFSYIPFSAGPRNCIGQRFAILEEKSIISAVMRNFELKAVTKPDELQFRADLVLRTTVPIFVKFVPRIKIQK